MGKGDIARYEQFLLFPQCFQKACFPGASKGVIVWEWVKQNLVGEPLYHQINSVSSIHIPISLLLFVTIYTESIRENRLHCMTT